MPSFFDTVTKNRKATIEVSGRSTVPIFQNQVLTVLVEAQSFKINTGENPNEVDFFINFDNSNFNKNRLPFNAGQNGTNGEVIRFRVYGPNKAFYYDFHFKLISYRFITVGEKRGVSYRGKDMVRLWASQQPIYMTFNVINSRDYYDNFRSNLGYYWTNSSGSINFEEASPTSDNWLGLTNAYHALHHVFYTPKRDAIRRGAGGDYPSLKIDPSVADDLRDFILPPKQYQPNNMLSAMMDVIQSVSSKYTIAIQSKGSRLSDHTVYVFKLGRGPILEAYANENSSFGKKLNFQDFAIQNHNPAQKKIVVLSDESTAITDHQIDAVKYKGAPIQYFVHKTPLVPAWDWWNDYNIFVRNSSNLKLIPQFHPNGSPNAEYPSWLSGILNSLPQQYRIENLSRSFDLSTPDDPKARQYIFAMIDYTWSVITQAMKMISMEEKSKYLINFGVMDYLIKPEDSIHRYRFTRFIAVPKGTNSFVPTVDPKTGWDHPDLKRFKNILPSVVDGKRQNISANFLTSQLKKTDTYHLNIPVIVEAELPNYTDHDGEYGKRATDESGVMLAGNRLEWRQIDSVQVDGEHGYFFIQSPQDNCMYWDKATVSVGPNPANYDYYRGSAAVPGQPTSPDADERLPHFQIPIMKSGGPSGTTIEMEYLPFRTRLRATFYFTKEETFRNLFDDGNDPTLPKWYYDYIAPNPERNDPWLAGIVTPKDITSNEDLVTEGRRINLSDPKTRFEFIEDNNMVWQVPFYSDDDNSIAKIGDPTDPNNKGLLQAQIFNKDTVPGRIYINLQWRHRDDRKLLFEKAKRKLMELMDPVFGGVIETLDVFDIGYGSNINGGNGYGLGSIRHNGFKMPISGFSVDFNNLRSMLEFDITPPRYGAPIELERITPVFAAEGFQALEDNRRLSRLDSSQVVQDGINRPRKKMSQVYNGYRLPWQNHEGKQKFYTTPNYQYGRRMSTPSVSQMNPGLQLVSSFGSSVLPTSLIDRDQFVESNFKHLPELKNTTMVSQSYITDEGKA